MANRLQAPSQKLGNELPGMLNARPAPASAMESLNVELGRYMKMLGEELMKGKNADPTQVARAKAGIMAADRAGKGQGAAQQQPQQFNGSAGSAPRPAPNQNIDALTQKPMTGAQGNTTQPF